MGAPPWISAFRQKLLNISINDLQKNRSALMKFAGDTNLGDISNSCGITQQKRNDPAFSNATWQAQVRRHYVVRMIAVSDNVLIARC